MSVVESYKPWSEFQDQSTGFEFGLKSMQNLPGLGNNIKGSNLYAVDEKKEFIGDS